MDRSESLSFDDIPKYQYRPLEGDDIRLIELQPGPFEDDLVAETVHYSLDIAPTRTQQSHVQTTKIDKTLPQGWRSFRTPEGRLLYSDESYGGGT